MRRLALLLTACGEDPAGTASGFTSVDPGTTTGTAPFAGCYEASNFTLE